MTTQETNICNRCDHKGTCNTSDCIYNPNAKNLFISANQYYPLELNGDHIYLWDVYGKAKYTIALFRYDEKEESWSIQTIGSRIIDDRVNYKHLYELYKLGFEIRVSEKPND